ncbi:hypothetical protein CDL12_09492 [Handroanthus impetiginosus]|uniref:Uncharacterized protein n=1 Tax=Handroanthus impetiginosus TaxID=429701 RepID=A0A2G9HK86_9LAMI|nr:hypothetical protein CDL12_09492 [Handroanthus impetiginosus]
MHQSSCTGKLQYNLEIEKTAWRLRKETKLRNKQASSLSSDLETNFNLTKSSDFKREEAMANKRTLRELAAPDLTQQLLSIEYPKLDVLFMLKYGLIHLLFTFRAHDMKQRNGCFIFLLVLSQHRQIWKFLNNSCSNTSMRDFYQLRDRRWMQLLEYFGIGHDSSRKVNEIKSSSREHQISNLTSLVQQLVIGKMQKVKTCGICANIGHPTEYSNKYANAIGRFSGSPRREYDPYLNTYNLGRRIIQISTMEQGHRIFSIFNPGHWLRHHIPLQIQNEHSRNDASIQNLEIQVSQLATSISKMESQGELPSQTIVNPEQNVCAVTLRNDKELKKSIEVKEEEEKEILENCHRVEVNISLFDAIQQIPCYAKFFKELCTNKKKLKGNFRIEMAMYDLGSSINVMPLFLYSSLNVGPLKETGVIIQLADSSVVYSKKIPESVLVQVNGLVFPVDFYVLNMTEDNYPNSTPILLGKSFVRTSKTKIDVHDGTLTIEFDSEIIKLDIYDTTKNSGSVSCVFDVNVANSFTYETMDSSSDGYEIQKLVKT